MKNRVSVIGLGKLGACMAATMAAKGMQVAGVDINSRSVELINQGIAPVVEPGLADLIKNNRERLWATSNYKKAIFESDITFVIVPTPSDEQGGFSINYVVEAFREIGAALREKTGYHLVVITSTVLPGATEFGLLPVLEQASGKKAGQHFGLCYNPEFIALGSVIHDLLNPDFVLIGESDPKAGRMLEDWYKTYCDNRPHIARMNFVNAELAKISVNSFVTMKITFANTLASLCEQLPGGDVDEVSNALGFDSRIGRRYLTGALSYGGPCFPRDNKALMHVAEKAGVSAPLAETTDRLNQTYLSRLAGKIREHLRPGMSVSVLGLAYKPDTNVVEESPGIVLSLLLVEAGHHVVVYDPLALDNARQILKDKVVYAGSLSESLKKADLIVLVNPNSEFKALGPESFQRKSEPVVIFDCWRLLRSKLENVPGIHYVPLGVGESLSLESKVLDRAVS